MNFTLPVLMGILVVWVVPASAQQATSDAPLSPPNVYDYCMPIETKAVAARLVAEKKDLDPKVIAHFKCTFYARECREDPRGESCVKSLGRLSDLKARE
jgi:hypothetical protein